MEKIVEALTVEGDNPVQIKLQDVPSVHVSRRKKPRALVIKASNRDFDEITEIIKQKFPDVQILYVTTGPAASILRVTKSIPVELQSTSE